MPRTPDSILALDVGQKRIGLAIVSLSARLPRPLTTIDAGDNFLPALQEIIETENVMELVVGLPRGLSGQETAQTVFVRDFVRNLGRHIKLNIHFQDEAVTSLKAETELKARGQAFNKGDIDSLAATYILEDYLNNNSKIKTTI